MKEQRTNDECLQQIADGVIMIFLVLVVLCIILVTRNFSPQFTAEVPINVVCEEADGITCTYDA